MIQLYMWQYKWSKKGLNTHSYVILCLDSQQAFPRGLETLSVFCSWFNSSCREKSRCLLKEVHNKNCGTPWKGHECKCWEVSPCVWFSVTGVTAPHHQILSLHTASSEPSFSQYSPQLSFATSLLPGTTGNLHFRGTRTHNSSWTELSLSWKYATFSSKNTLPICAVVMFSKWNKWWLVVCLSTAVIHHWLEGTEASEKNHIVCWVVLQLNLTSSPVYLFIVCDMQLDHLSLKILNGL